MEELEGEQEVLKCCSLVSQGMSFAAQAVLFRRAYVTDAESLRRWNTPMISAGGEDLRRHVRICYVGREKPITQDEQMSGEWRHRFTKQKDSLAAGEFTGYEQEDGANDDAKARMCCWDFRVSGG